MQMQVFLLHLVGPGSVPGVISLLNRCLLRVSFVLDTIVLDT